MNCQYNTYNVTFRLHEHLYTYDRDDLSNNIMIILILHANKVIVLSKDARLYTLTT